MLIFMKPATWEEVIVTVCRVIETVGSEVLVV